MLLQCVKDKTFHCSLRSFMTGQELKACMVEDLKDVYFVQETCMFNMGSCSHHVQVVALVNFVCWLTDTYMAFSSQWHPSLSLLSSILKL